MAKRDVNGGAPSSIPRDLAKPTYTGWLARRPLSEHPLVRADQVPRRLAEDGAPAILDSAPEVLVTPCPASRRIVRRADHVRNAQYGGLCVGSEHRRETLRIAAPYLNQSEVAPAP